MLELSRYARPMDQTVQVIGALLILFAYGGAQSGVLGQRSRLYLILDLVGSAVLALLAWRANQWGFLLSRVCGLSCRCGD